MERTLRLADSEDADPVERGVTASSLGAEGARAGVPRSPILGVVSWGVCPRKPGGR